MTTTQYMADELPGGQALDDALRSLLDGPLELGTELEGLADRSRVTNRVRLRMRVGEGRGVRWRPRILAVALVAIAMLGAVAFVPALRPGGGNEGGLELTPSANAGAVLRWAGTAVVRDGATATGNGPVWHSVTAEYTGDRLVHLDERFVEAEGGDYERILASSSGTQGTATATIERFDGKVFHVRQFVRPTGDKPWMVMPEGSVDSMRVQTSSAPYIQGAGDDVYEGATVDIETATIRWIRAASTETTEAELVRATRIFLRTTRGFYGTARLDNRRAQEAITMQQVIHLLTVSQVTPEATRVLYDQVAGFRGLKRLDDAQLDGRDVVRVQFDVTIPDDPEAVNPGTLGMSMQQRREAKRERAKGEARVERIVVIDAKSGRPLRTESLDGEHHTDIALATRVDALGDERVACTLAPFLDCSIFDPQSVLGAQAEAQARSPRMVRIAATSGSNISFSPYLTDDDGIPLDMTPENPTAFSKPEVNGGKVSDLLPLAPLPDDYVEPKDGD